MARYVVQFDLGSNGVLTAGSQGLTLVDCEVSCSSTSITGGTVGVTLSRNATITPGSGFATPLNPLREGDVIALSTALFSIGGGIPSPMLKWLLPLSGEHDLRLFQRHPVYVAPGSNICFNVVGAGSPEVSLNVYVEE
jgi:hypothetical protein